MPVEVRGLKESLRALKNFQPDIEKNLNKEIRAFANPVIRNAQSFVDSSAGGLTNWTVGGSAKKFKESQPAERKGFPKFNASSVKRGIRLSTKPTQRNKNGFISVYRIVNSNAAGAIYETAGRKNANHGKSARPNFSNAIGEMAGREKMRGRLIFKSWEENKGHAQGNILKAIDKTLMQFHRTVSK
jgi:hypothetical protein